MYCPFTAAGYIQNVEQFIGRVDELTFLAHRMNKQSPTSVNIYGARRMGKSSLLYHFFITWENRVKPEDRAGFAVAYVSLAQMEFEAEFYQTLAETWRHYAPLAKHTLWQDTWSAPTWTRHRFNEALAVCKETIGILPVACLDDIEPILKYRAVLTEEAILQHQDFNDSFYDNLRATMTRNQLMLIIVSLEPLQIYKYRYKLTSMFFNQGHSIALTEFKPTEVETLMSWADQVNFSEQQKEKMRQWGKQHPYLLQLAGVCLWEAQVTGQAETVAHQHFEENKQRNLYSAPLPPEKLSKKMIKPFEWLGRLADWFAEKWHHAHLIVIGMVMVVAVILILVLGISKGFQHIVEHPLEYFKQIWDLFFGHPPEKGH